MMLSPVVTIIGRPNTGKSTLFNRLIQRRVAIVDKTEGITRDRIYGNVEWTGYQFTIVDTGGYIPDLENELESAVRRQIKLAIQESDCLLFIVDGRDGMTSLDVALADLIRQSNKKSIMVVNKIDNSEQELLQTEFYSLGFDKMVTISALLGRKIGDLLDLIIQELEPRRENLQEKNEGIKIAIVGMPNVGKSSIVNALLGQEKAIVTKLPGTTRDAIDSTIKYYGKIFVLIDTAGLRKKSRIKNNIEYYSQLRTEKAIDRSHVVMVIMDAVKGFGKQDQHIISAVIQKGRGLLLVVNKWDLVKKTPSSQEDFKRTITRLFKAMEFYPILFISAKTKQGISKLLPECQEVYNRWIEKIATSKLNKTLQQILQRVQPPAIKGKNIKIKFVSQIGQAPPKFRFYCNFPDLIPVSYKNYLENQMRIAMVLHGVPIKLSFTKSV